MPAPAVIPALIAYVKVVAVKTLVVGARLSETCVGPPGQLPFGARWGSGKGGRWPSVPLTSFGLHGLSFGAGWVGGANHRD